MPLTKYWLEMCFVVDYRKSFKGDFQTKKFIIFLNIFSVSFTWRVFLFPAVNGIRISYPK